MFNLYTADVRERPQNTIYRKKRVIATVEDLKEAARFDHMAGQMKDGLRNAENFVGSNVLIFDLDNTHSEDPDAWVSLDDINDAFPGVLGYAIQSRNYMREKTCERAGKKYIRAPREKWHVYFPLSNTVDGDQYEEMTHKAARIFPYFDEAALDRARFLFGVSDPHVEEISGDLTIDQFLASVPDVKPAKKGKEQTESIGHKKVVLPETIQISHRNQTLHRLACSLQAQGLPDAAIAQAIRESNAELCDPPLEDREVSSIIKSALKYEKGAVRAERAAEDDSPAWAEGLALIRTKTGEIRNCFSNYVEILGAAPLLDGNIWRDGLSGRIMLQNVPWNVGAHELDDTDIYQLRWRFDKRFGLSNENNLRQAVTILADQHRRHPIVEWLESLPPWDGVSRLGRLFPRYLGAEDSEYVTAVTKLLFFGMRQRVYHPGIKFDLCITLADTRQGTGKSSMCRLLAGRDEWARDAIGDLHNAKETFEAMSGAWVVELGELIATRRTKDVETIKAFLSRVEDIYRTPYSTYPRHYPRQCVFIGTTNRPQFLPEDPTGNRRFIPIICDGSKAERHPLEDESEARAYIAKCFAEALVLGEAEGWPLTLDEKFDAQLAAFQETATPEDTRIGRIQSYLDASDLDKVCTQIIWADVFAGDGIAPSRKELQEIADIMSLKIDGWRRYRGGGERHTFWFGKKIGAQRAWERIGSPLCSPLGSGLGFTDAPDDIDDFFSQEL